MSQYRYLTNIREYCRLQGGFQDDQEQHHQQQEQVWSHSRIHMMHRSPASEPERIAGVGQSGDKAALDRDGKSSKAP